MGTVRRKVLWWNVERLFAPGPSALAQALGADVAASVYKKRIAALGAVMRAAACPEEVALVGLGEVASSRVVRDLLKAAGYKHLVEAEEPSPHRRLAGLDLSLAYDPRLFDLVGEPQSHHLHLRFDTRDIYEVVLQPARGEPVLLLLNHWPSRKMSTAEPMRMGLGDYAARLVARFLKATPDELITPTGRLSLPPRTKLAKRWSRSALIMGDFNDEPFSISVERMMRARRAPESVSCKLRLPRARKAATHAYLNLMPELYNPTSALLARRNGGPPGTYFYSGQWWLLDQLVMSAGTLHDDANVRYVPGSLGVFGDVCVPTPTGKQDVCTSGGRPLSFDEKSGRGASDHLPLVFSIDLPG